MSGPKPAPSHALCICGHERAYHDGVSGATRWEQRVVWYRCCKGNFPLRTCRCPRFRLAIAQPSDRERIENTRPT